MKGKILELAMMAAMINGGTANRSDLTPEDIKLNDRTVVPKGCKEYFFDIEGHFSNDKMHRDLCVFKCVARTNKKAVEKFNKWKANRNI